MESQFILLLAVYCLSVFARRMLFWRPYFVTQYGPFF